MKGVSVQDSTYDVLKKIAAEKEFTLHAVTDQLITYGLQVYNDGKGDFQFKPKAITKGKAAKHMAKISKYPDKDDPPEETTVISVRKSKKAAVESEAPC